MAAILGKGGHIDGDLIATGFVAFLFLIIAGIKGANELASTFVIAVGFEVHHIGRIVPPFLIIWTETERAQIMDLAEIFGECFNEARHRDHVLFNAKFGFFAGFRRGGAFLALRHRLFRLCILRKGRCGEEGRCPKGSRSEI